ncbi:MAG: hypothetical protein K0R46_2835 [Herbinix sp.]|jgi:hypothetical protein|nr:hypothetical protein [Herbinix sp.]
MDLQVGLSQDCQAAKFMPVVNEPRHASFLENLLRRKYVSECTHRRGRILSSGKES